MGGKPWNKSSACKIVSAQKQPTKASIFWKNKRRNAPELDTGTPQIRPQGTPQSQREIGTLSGVGKSRVYITRFLGLEVLLMYGCWRTYPTPWAGFYCACWKQEWISRAKAASAAWYHAAQKTTPLRQARSTGRWFGLSRLIRHRIVHTTKSPILDSTLLQNAQHTNLVSFAWFISTSFWASGKCCTYIAEMPNYPASFASISLTVHKAQYLIIHYYKTPNTMSLW